MGETYSTHARRIFAYRFLVGKREGKRTFGRHKRRWRDNIKMDLYRICWCGVD
jgi:hypothetical protein